MFLTYFILKIIYIYIYIYITSLIVIMQSIMEFSSLRTVFSDSEETLLSSNSCWVLPLESCSQKRNLAMQSIQPVVLSNRYYHSMSACVSVGKVNRINQHIYFFNVIFNLTFYYYYILRMWLRMCLEVFFI